MTGRKIFRATVQNLVATPGLFHKGQNKKDKSKSRRRRMTIMYDKKEEEGEEENAKAGWEESKRKLR